MSNERMVTITQIGSPIGRKNSQRLILKGLGLNKLNRSKTLVFNSSIKGMIDKVLHLVKFEII